MHMGYSSKTNSMWKVCKERHPNTCQVLSLICWIIISLVEWKRLVAWKMHETMYQMSMTIAVIPKHQMKKVNSGLKPLFFFWKSFPNEKKGFDGIVILKVQTIICVLSSKITVNVYMIHWTLTDAFIDWVMLISFCIILNNTVDFK